MDKLTKAEYRILHSCARKSCKIDEYEANILLGYNYIRPDYKMNELDSANKYYAISHDGQVAYEHYHNYVYERRATSFRAWLALGVSFVSIALTIYNMSFMPA